MIYKYQPDSEENIWQIAFQRNRALLATNMARINTLLYYRSINNNIIETTIETHRQGTSLSTKTLTVTLRMFIAG